MDLQGYRAQEVTPWETASGGKAIICSYRWACSAGFRYEGAPGWFDVRVQYFDQNNGASRFRLSVAGQAVAEWKADDKLPTDSMNGHSSTRRVITGIALRPGDEILIEGFPDGGEPAPLDYVEISPSGASRQNVPRVF